MENKESIEKKNFYYKLLIAIAIIVPIIIGLSYAFFLARIKGDTTTITGTAVTEFNFNLNTENDGYIDAVGMIPINEEAIETDAETGTFTVVSGNNTYGINYTLALTDITITEYLKTEDFKWKLVCTSCSDTSNDATGTFENYNDGDLLLKQDIFISPNSTEEYKIYLWIGNTDNDQNNTMNQSFRGKVSAEAEFVVTN